MVGLNRRMRLALPWSARPVPPAPPPAGREAHPDPEPPRVLTAAELIAMARTARAAGGRPAARG